MHPFGVPVLCWKNGALQNVNLQRAFLWGNGPRKQGVLEKGVTILYAESGYLRQKTELVRNIVSKRELPRLERMIREIDPERFVVISRVSEVRAGFFPWMKYIAGDFVISVSGGTIARKNLRWFLSCCFIRSGSRVGKQRPQQSRGVIKQY